MIMLYILNVPGGSQLIQNLQLHDVVIYNITWVNSRYSCTYMYSKGIGFYRYIRMLNAVKHTYIRV